MQPVQIKQVLPYGFQPLGVEPWGMEIREVDNFEFYYRRKNTFYFRNGITKFSIDFNTTPVPAFIKGRKYVFEINHQPFTLDEIFEKTIKVEKPG